VINVILVLIVGEVICYGTAAYLVLQGLI